MQIGPDEDIRGFIFYMLAACTKAGTNGQPLLQTKFYQDMSNGS